MSGISGLATNAVLLTTRPSRLDCGLRRDGSPASLDWRGSFVVGAAEYGSLSAVITCSHKLPAQWEPVGNSSAIVEEWSRGAQCLPVPGRCLRMRAQSATSGPGGALAIARARGRRAGGTKARVNVCARRECPATTQTRRSADAFPFHARILCLAHLQVCGGAQDCEPILRFKSPQVRMQVQAREEATR